MKNAISIIPNEIIEAKIFVIRSKKVILDRDLAKLYNVETRMFMQSVKRNINRFPEDFMFQLNKDEFNNLISQFVTSRWGGTRKLPFAFTEQGVAMLSSVLKSERAINVNIQIMRAFTKLRELIMSHADLKKKIELMENKYDKQFSVVFDAIKLIRQHPLKQKGKIGFKIH